MEGFGHLGGTDIATYFGSSDVVGLSHNQDEEMTPNHEKRDGQDVRESDTNSEV